MSEFSYKDPSRHFIIGTRRATAAGLLPWRQRGWRGIRIILTLFVFCLDQLNLFVDHIDQNRNLIKIGPVTVSRAGLVTSKKKILFKIFFSLKQFFGEKKCLWFFSQNFFWCARACAPHARTHLSHQKLGRNGSFLFVSIFSHFYPLSGHLYGL